MEDILLALGPIVLIVAVAAVIILRPLAKRLGDILELQHREKTAQRLQEGEHRRLRDLIASLEQRLDLMEQRLDFTERLVEGSPARRQGDAPLPGPARGRDGETGPAGAARSERGREKEREGGGEGEGEGEEHEGRGP